MFKKRPIPARDELQKLCADGLTFRGLSKHYGVSLGLIHKWMKVNNLEPRKRGVRKVTAPTVVKPSANLPAGEGGAFSESEIDRLVQEARRKRPDF